MSENETHTRGDLDKALCFCGRTQVLKKATRRRKDPPYSSLTQAVSLSPSHGSGQDTHSSGWANLKQIVTNLKQIVTGKGAGGRKAVQQKPGQDGVAKTSFDRKDTMLLPTQGCSRYKEMQELGSYHLLLKTCNYLKTCSSSCPEPRAPPSWSPR